MGEIRAAGRRALALLRVVLAVVFSTLAEKNPLRQRETPAPFVLSASRAVILALVVVWCVVALRHGVDGWPMAVLGIGLAFALPLCRALEKSTPGEVLEYGKAIIGKMGGGGDG